MPFFSLASTLSAWYLGRIAPNAVAASPPVVVAVVFSLAVAETLSSAPASLAPSPRTIDAEVLTVGSHSTAGAVNILLGSAAGLSASGTEFWNQDSPNINNTGETDDEFGVSVAFGDFDGNGFADLTVGVPYEEVDYLGAALLTVF